MSRRILTFVAVPAKHLAKKNHGGLLSHYQVGTGNRNLNTHALSPAVTLISNGKTKHLRNKPDLSAYSSEGRPLTVLLCWLMAKNNALKKYAKFYLDHGYDVLTVRITPGQLLLPARAEPIVRNELIPTLLSSDHETKLIHGFSVGGYVFARMLNQLRSHPKGEDLLRTIKAQIWDSVVDVNGVSIGVSKSVFMKNQMAQQALQNYIDFHMNAFYQVATKYYVQAHDTFYNEPLKAPALFFGSEIDRISTMDVVEEVRSSWREQGIPCDHQVWSDTAHVGHMRVYPDEYQTILKEFLDKHGVHKPQRRVVTPEVAARRSSSQVSRDIPLGAPQAIPNVAYYSTMTRRYVDDGSYSGII